MERNKEECGEQPLNPEDRSDSAKVPPMMSQETGETNASEEDEICTTLEEVVGTLDEIEEAEEERAKMAELLLGGCLDLVCTYPEGYKFRQPLYSCKTCFSKTGQLAGICYACSENCHEGHDMVELYTKRNFCCDCGNSKFENKCKLFEEKDPTNKNNKYNDNFKGIFCVCKKLYPPEGDDDTSASEEMIQCCVCEDWFHPSHVFGQKASSDKEDTIPDDIEGIICPNCINNHPFLTFYPFAKGQCQENDNSNTGGQCKLESYKASAKGQEMGQTRALWVWSGWRSQLCKCKNCMNLYDDLNCPFLVEHEDTITYYEQHGREKANQLREKESSKEMSRTDVINALGMATAIEEMKKHCVEFFAKRSTEKRTITCGDVEECFEELRAKRQKIMQQMGEGHPTDGAWTQ